MEYVNIDKVQTLFNELMSWDKQKFIKENMKFANPEDVLEFCEIDENLDKIPYDELCDEEKLDLIDINVIKKYLDEYEKS